MAFEWAKLGDWVQLKPRFLVGIGLVASALLFLPPSALAAIGLESFTAAYRPWIGAAFVAAVAILAAHGVAAVGDVVNGRVTEFRKVRAYRSQVKSLGPEEKALLRKYIEGGRTTLQFSISNGVANGLEARHFLYRASSVSSYHTNFPYNIQPWAWDYLRKHPNLLAGPDIEDDDA